METNTRESIADPRRRLSGRPDEATVRPFPQPATAPSVAGSAGEIAHLTDAAVELSPEQSKAAPGHRSRWWRDARRRRMLAAADVVSAVTIGAVVAGLAGAPYVWALAAAPLGLVGAKLIGLYDTDHRAIRHLTIDEFGAVATWCALLFLICSLIVPGEISVGAAGALMPFAVVLALGLRAAARLAWRLITPPERVLMVGRGDPAALVARKIELFADVHMR